MGATHIVEEELETDGELAEEVEDVKTRCGKPPHEASFKRFSFFYAPFQAEQDSGVIDYAETSSYILLGYVVIACLKLPNGDKRAYVFEAVLQPPAKCELGPDGILRLRPITNYFVHCCRDFKTVIGTRSENHEFKITGSFFCQQNNLTHVCANACLKMALNTSWAKDQERVTNQRINAALGIHHKTEKTRLGHYDREPKVKGLTTGQMEQVIKAFKLSPLNMDFLPQPLTDYAEFLYPFVESGIPVIIDFMPDSQSSHVITVVGHTMNSDKWDCEAHVVYDPEPRLYFPFCPYHASATWVDHFLVNDDNFGMYSAMPLSHLRNPVLPSHDLTKRARNVISIFPLDSNVYPYAAEQQAAIHLFNALGTFDDLRKPDQASKKSLFPSRQENRWLHRLIDQGLKGLSEGRRVVMRTVFARQEKYLDHFDDVAELTGKKEMLASRRAFLAGYLPPHFWVTEITLPDLYSANKHKLGDIICSSRSEGNDPYRPDFLWGWLPGVELSASSENLADWPVKEHVPLFESNPPVGPVDIW